MRKASTLAAAACISLAAVAAPGIAWSAPKKNAPTVATDAAGRTFTIRPEARLPFRALETAVKAKDQAAYPGALAAAQAVAATPDEKYVLAKYQLQHGIDSGNSAEQILAFEAIVASGRATEAELPGYRQSIGILAFNAGDWRKAEEAFDALVRLRPDDTDGLVNLALTRMRLGRNAEALPLFERAIAAAKAAGAPAPDAWYQNAVRLAFEAKNPKALALSREAMEAYPTPENWRNRLSVYREMVPGDDAAKLDFLRLMRVSGAMQSAGDYYSLASLLSQGAVYGEAKAVLDAGVAAGVARVADSDYRTLMAFVGPKIAGDRPSLAVVETKAKAAAGGGLALRTADAFYGYGDYQKAAALYRAALAKTGVDAGTANLRLGMALAMAGDKAGAEAAFRAVAGPRAELAGLWLSWLARRP